MAELVLVRRMARRTRSQSLPDQIAALREQIAKIGEKAEEAYVRSIQTQQRLDRLMEQLLQDSMNAKSKRK